MLLQDFNYFFNKALNQYINRRYSIYDVNQQTTDDLRVLKTTAFLDAVKVTESSPYKDLNIGDIFEGFYEVSLPADYLHLLNCICVYEVNKNYKCYKKGDTVQYPAIKITADAWPMILNDYYNRPKPQKPYYYIHNVNQNTTLPTNPVGEDIVESTGLQKGTDISKLYGVVPSESPTGLGGGVDDTKNKKKSNFKRTIKLGHPITSDGIDTISTVNKEIGMRYGNPSNVRMEIRCGNDPSFTLKKVFIDYLKTPQTVILTQEQLNLTEDTSQIIEFPDYACQEIINELVRLVMENNADPRLQSVTAVSQSIASPVQQQTQ